MFDSLKKKLVSDKGLYFNIKNLDLSKPLVEEGGPYVCAWSDYAVVVKVKEVEPEKERNLFHFTPILN